MSVVLAHGDKGGVGKSATAAIYGEYLAGKGLPFLVVETDTRNPDVGRFLRGVADVENIDLRHPTGWMDLVNVLDAAPVADVVIALPGNIGTEIATHAPMFAGALGEMGRRLSVLWTMNRSLDSIALLKPSLAAFPTATTVVVRNTHYGDAPRFTRWNDSKFRKDFLAEGGLEMDLPDLHDRSFDATFGVVPPVRFSTYAAEGAYLAERTAVKMWMRATFAAFDGLAAKIGVGER
ncbi:MAG: P-loop NTPase family protein [Vulcanimicrobiaceae bacterium]